jgi:hypothetical protein
MKSVLVINMEGNVHVQILELSLWDKIFVGCGHFVNDITASMWFSYFLLFAQNLLKLSPNEAAFLKLFGQVTFNIKIIKQIFIILAFSLWTEFQRLWWVTWRMEVPHFISTDWEDINHGIYLVSK